MKRPSALLQDTPISSERMIDDELFLCDEDFTHPVDIMDDLWWETEEYASEVMGRRVYVSIASCSRDTIYKQIENDRANIDEYRRKRDKIQKMLDEDDEWYLGQGD